MQEVNEYVCLCLSSFVVLSGTFCNFSGCFTVGINAHHVNPSKTKIRTPSLNKRKYKFTGIQLEVHNQCIIYSRDATTFPHFDRICNSVLLFFSIFRILRGFRCWRPVSFIIIIQTTRDRSTVLRMSGNKSTVCWNAKSNRDLLQYHHQHECSVKYYALHCFLVCLLLKDGFDECECDGCKNNVKSKLVQ